MPESASAPVTHNHVFLGSSHEQSEHQTWAVI